MSVETQMDRFDSIGNFVSKLSMSFYFFLIIHRFLTVWFGEMESIPGVADKMYLESSILYIPK